MREELLKKFRKEVDFHHKICFRFEKAYRLVKKLNPQNSNFLNMEIIDCISEHSKYIEHDPAVFFYCLFFCAFYKNSQLVEFFRKLI